MTTTPRTATGSRAAARSTLLRWLLLALGIAIAGGLVLFAMAAAHPFGTDRHLEDFATPEEARAFASTHLPAPLPNDAIVEALLYQRWTDWNFSARVRLPSADAVDQYLERVRRDRQLNDDYCYHSEPSHGARYFLKHFSACGSVERTSAHVLEVRCNTR